MKLIRTEDFARSLLELPAEIQRFYAAQEKRFKENWRDPRLHIKKMRGLVEVFSFRVTRRYRVLFYFQNGENVILFEIDHRKDIYD